MNEDVEDRVDDLGDDDWAKAFAALEGEGAQDDPSDNDAAGGVTDADDAGQVQVDEGERGDDAQPQGEDGGPVPEGGMDGVAAAVEAGGFDAISQREIDAEVASARESARSQAISDMVQEFIGKGEHSVNGKLGYSIDDKDVCKRDQDGVPHYYNPDTGRPFNGDNPRRQAMEWCEDYNKELADKFNKACAQREAQIMQTEEPRLNTLRFQPTYSRLDPIRQGMLDDLISDYEIKDSDGDVIGYSCDLDQALAVVNRQVARIQEYAKNRPKPATGPAMDMKTSSGAHTGKSPDAGSIKSIEEAMEYEQNKLLEELRNRSKR